MIVYKDKYTIPTFNWLMISEKGFDLSYLIRLKFLKRFVNKTKLYKIYMKILYTLDDVNVSLLAKYTDWQVLLTEHRAEYIKYKANLLINKEYNFNVADLEKAFREYINELMKYYKDFEFTEYFFNPDYKEIAKESAKKELTKQDYEILARFKDIRFYTWDEYNMFLQKNPELIFLGVLKEFKDNFISHRTIKINDLVKIDTYLSDVYSHAKMYNDYQFIRSKLFDINVLQSDRKEEHSVFDEVAILSDILGYQIDTKKTSLAEYESIKLQAKRKSEKLKNKPKEAGKRGRI